MFRAEPPFSSIAPSFSHQIDEEPDHVELNGKFDYDAQLGRMGSVCNVVLQGSDDDTSLEAFLRTEVLIYVPIDRVRPEGVINIHGMRVSLLATCNESWAKGRTEDEAGVSGWNVNLSSRFYLRFPDSLASARQSFFDAVSESSDWGSESLNGPFLIVEQRDVEKSFDLSLVEEASTHKVVLDTKPPVGLRAEMPVIVGLEDKTRVWSNDVSYDVTYASSWTLDAVEFSVI